MKTYNNTSTNMLDMIFENKNKDYGAYAIRTTYNDALIKSLTIVASALFLLIGSTYAYNKFYGEKPIVKEFVAEQLDFVLPVDMKPIDVPTPKVEPPSGPAQASAAISTNFDDDAVEDPNQPNTLSTVASIGDTTGTQDPNGVGSGEGPVTSTITIVAPPIEPTSIPEVMPEFPGGIQALKDYLENNTHYPQMELEAGIQGKVFVKFVVNTDGSITRAEVLKGVAGGDGLEKEALRVVRAMPRWKPGKQGNNAVPVYFNLPIIFKTN